MEFSVEHPATPIKHFVLTLFVCVSFSECVGMD